MSVLLDFLLFFLLVWTCFLFEHNIFALEEDNMSAFLVLVYVCGWLLQDFDQDLSGLSCLFLVNEGGLYCEAN